MLEGTRFAEKGGGSNSLKNALNVCGGSFEKYGEEGEDKIPVLVPTIRRKKLAKRAAGRERDGK